MAQENKSKYNTYQRSWRKIHPEEWRAIQMKWYNKNKGNSRKLKCPPYGDEDIIRFINEGDEKKLKIIERMLEDGS